MHPAAYKAMQRCVADFVPQDRRLTVVDLGSGTVQERLDEGMTHGALFAEYDAEIIGVDVVAKPNVDIVLDKPYSVPMKSNSVDVVISGQVFEHLPFFWASMLEIARMLKPGGLFIMTAPSRGHPHGMVDCWRYYDDGIRAMAAFTGLIERRARTHPLPTRRKTPGRFFDVEANVDVEGYWGDTVGVLQKPPDYPTRRMVAVRGPVVWWANRTAPAFAEMVAEDTRRKRARARRRATKAARQRAASEEAIEAASEAQPSHSG
jgi:SAM-dependent methyltransferase